jgi:hypothetical protein
MALVAIAAACFAFLPGVLAVGLVAGLTLAMIWPRSSRCQAVELTAAVIWLAAAVSAFSDVAVDFLASLVLLGSGLAIAISWISRLILGQLPFRSWRDRAVVLSIPAVGLIGLVLLETDRDLRIRLALSEPALRSSARDAYAGRIDTSYRGDRRIGLFRVYRIEVQSGCVLWLTGSFIDSYGIAYCPGPPPNLSPDFKCWHVYGPWYRWEIEF